MAKRTTIPGMTPDAFVTKVKNKNTGPVAIIIDENKLVTQNLFSLVKNELIEKGTEDFCFELIHADSDEVTGGTIVSAVETISMLGGFRVVWVKYTEELASADLEIITDFIDKALKNNIDDVLLVLVFGYYDGRSKFFKYAAANDLLVYCKQETIKNIPSYVQRQFGKKITASAANLIKQLVGNDALATKNEIDKVCLFVGENDTVTEDDVREICMDVAARNEWELSNRILSGNVASVIKFLAELDKSGLDEMYRHAIITTAIINLQKAKNDVKSGAIYRNSFRYPNPRAIAKHVSEISEYKMQDLLSWLMYSEIGAKGGNLPVKILDDIACLKASSSNISQTNEINKTNTRDDILSSFF